MSRSQKQTTRRRKPSVAEEIIAGLSEFAEVVKSGQPVREVFNCRRVRLDLRPSPYDAGSVRATRDLLGASQSVFALLLGVSASTVRAWEQGAAKPSGMARRFMDEIRVDPERWVERLKRAAVPKKVAGVKT